MKLVLPKGEILGPEDFKILTGCVICQAIEDTMIEFYTSPIPAWYSPKNTVQQNNAFIRCDVDRQIKYICLNNGVSLWNSRRVVMEFSKFIDKLNKAGKRITLTEIF